MSDTDQSIFREVDEEVRQDEYKKLWDRHGRTVIAVVVLIIAAVAAYEGWKYYQAKQSEDAGALYFDAIRKAEAGKNDDALATFGAVTQSGYAQLSALREAGVLAQKGDTDKAVAAYDAFASDTSHDPALVDLARIRAGYLLVDTAKPDELLPRLGRYDTQTSVWRNQAREIFGLTAWRVKDFAMADRYMKAIAADSESTAAMRQRAELLIQLIAPTLPPK